MGYDESRLGGIIERVEAAEYRMRYYFRGEQPPLREVRGCDLTDPSNPLNKKIDVATLWRDPPHWHPPEEDPDPAHDMAPMIEEK